MKNLKISNAIENVTTVINRWKKKEEDGQMGADVMSNVPKVALEELSNFQKELFKNTGNKEYVKKTLKAYIDLMQGANLEGVLLQLSWVKDRKRKKTKEEILKTLDDIYSRVDKVQNMMYALYYMVDDQKILPN